MNAATDVIPPTEPHFLQVEQDQTVPDALKGESHKGAWEKFVSFVWDSDYYDKSDAERRLVTKIDCGLLICLTFGWLMKYIDQSNLANAYVSGMQTDLKITGNQYTYMQTIYNTVNCVMQIPSTMLIMKIRPSYYLTICELGWAVFTFAQAGARTYQDMYVFRFFVALFEAVFQPACFFMLGSWYTQKELGKRLAIWFIAAPAGQAFSGFMQAAIYKTMNGIGGLAGWRWLYIMCGVMTVPCGVFLLFFLPDFPHNSKAWYLTEEGREMAKARCAYRGQTPLTGILPWNKVLPIIKTWRFWLLVPTYLFYATSIQAYNYFAIYLKAEGYSVTLRNILPSVAYLIQIPFEYGYGFLADRMENRFLWCFLPLVWGLVPTGILAVWPASNALRVFAFMAATTDYITHVYMTWLNEICHASSEERGFIISCATTLFFAFNAWLPNVIFLQTDGPSFRKGFPTTFACNIVSVFLMVVVLYFHKRQLREEAAAEQECSEVIEDVDEKVLVDSNKDVSVVAIH